MELFEECRLTGDFTLSSGRQSQVFYDFDLLRPRETIRYADQLFRTVPREVVRETNFIACPALGGIVPGFIVAGAADRPLIIVDKEGNCRGPKVQGGSYLIIDDVLTSFKAANFVRAAFPSPKFKCLGVAAYIFRGSNGDLKKQDIQVYYLARKEQEI